MGVRGRVTLPVEVGMDQQVRELMDKLGADAVRNSDGTELPELVHELAAKVYSTYFPARGDQQWALANPDTTIHQYLQSERIVAMETPLRIDVMRGYLTEQLQPRTDVDLTKFWQVIDRTTGEPLPAGAWTLEDQRTVRIDVPEIGHVYTVGFLARQIWDSTQMYNYITNDWDSDPTRDQERPYDVRLPKVWDRVKAQLDVWLADHPEVDVVRFTTFFYHFTLVFNEQRHEKYVDWFGYSASVSPEALEEFAAEYGYWLTPEDFIDEGYYNCPFRLPSSAFRDWMEFQNRFVTARVRELTDQVHRAGKEAMMFLGDNWIAVEPYADNFADAGVDAVVGSVGNAATCRMISDIPHVRYTEGRFLPYFFPDVFNSSGDPIGEANLSWLAARRAIVRSPLDRIGYGGYLSLAAQFPDFVDRISHICQEFRDLHEAARGQVRCLPVRVAVLNAWGKLRSWQTHMVAHALPYEQTEPYVGVLEALAGLPFEVKFISFDEVGSGVLDDVDVVINVGQEGTAFSGGREWRSGALAVALRSFVARGGGVIGVGEPAAYYANGATCQLAEVFGVDAERSWSLSTDRYVTVQPDHFITAGASLVPEVSGGARYWVPLSQYLPHRQIVAMEGVSVNVAVNSFGQGRAVYFAGLPFSCVNSRILERAIVWAAGQEEAYAKWPGADDPRVEVACYDDGRVFVYNSSMDAVKSICSGMEVDEVELPPAGSAWYRVEPLT